MSSIISIIYVVFIWFFIKTIIKKSRGTGNNGGRKFQNTTQPEVKNGAPDQYTGNRNTTTPAGNFGTGSTNRPSAKASATETGKSSENTSVTDYLAEKARKDQIEHAREKQQESQRLAEKSGGLTPAERLYDGDPIPNGKFCVCCSYCAAENLIPVGSRMKYSCYFCREPLH